MFSYVNFGKPPAPAYMPPVRLKSKGARPLRASPGFFVSDCPFYSYDTNSPSNVNAPSSALLGEMVNV